MKITKAGELLQNARVKKKLTLDQVERAIKIRKKFLEAIESSNYRQIPTSYARGFVKNYAEYLGLDATFLLALFRRETNTSKEAVLPKGMVEINNNLLRMTPQRGFLLGIVLILSLISLFIFQQYQSFISAPVVTVDTPKNEETITEGDLEVRGKTTSDTTITINNNPITIDEDGNFAKRITVFKGEMTIAITAKNRQGKQTTIYRHIYIK